MTPGHVELIIERLVLPPVVAGDRFRIAEAVQRELTRLLAEQGVPASLARGGNVPSLDAGAPPPTAAHPADGFGTRLAEAIYKGLGG